MKKTLALLAVFAFTVSGAFAGALGDWAQQTTDKINAKEAAIQKQQAESQAKREAQRAKFEQKKEQFQKDRAAREAEQQAKKDAFQKRVETKKQLWNQLINE